MFVIRSGQDRPGGVNSSWRMKRKRKEPAPSRPDGGLPRPTPSLTNIDRVVHAIGIPLEPEKAAASSDFRAALDLDRFSVLTRE
jgi:hypothetical protein